MRKCTKISLAAVLATANLGFAVPAFAEELATYHHDRRLCDSSFFCYSAFAAAACGDWCEQPF